MLSLRLTEHSTSFEYVTLVTEQLQLILPERGVSKCIHLVSIFVTMATGYCLNE